MGSRHAEFLHNEVPGVTIPDDVRNRLRTASSAETEGRRIAEDLVQEFRGLAAGVYVMPQFGRFDVAAEIVDAARRG